MKKLFLSFLMVVIIAGAIFLSCKKGNFCEGCSENNKPPVATAGPDQVITLPTDSISLDGTASSDPDGMISKWLWKKIDGPASFAISNSLVAKTTAKDLVAGVYKFELTVTDNKSATAKDTMMVTVQGSAANHPPVANAGMDQTIYLPTNIANLDGSASSDPDKNISSYSWTRISGPASFNIANGNTAQIQVTNLTEGIYVFELKVTDSMGLFDRDTVVVQVTACLQPSPPPPCVTNCGKIVFVSNRDGNDEIYTCNADGSNIIRLTNYSAADAQPAWSPDGTRIAFIRSLNGGEKGDVYIVNADGSNLVRKTFSGNCIHPAWSPDGLKIAFNRMDFNAGQVAVIELSTGSVSIMPNSNGSSVDPSPAWSPDGTKIAFDSDWNAWDIVSDIFTICPNGGQPILLTPKFFNDYDYWKPAWSPDGSKLSVSIYRMVYQKDSVSQASICVMKQDGTGLTIILTGNMGSYSAVTKTSWSPDGTRIAFTSWATDNTKSIKWVATDGSAGGTIITNGWDADWKH